MDLGIEGRVALVMGASKGIGRGIAVALRARARGSRSPAVGGAAGRGRGRGRRGTWRSSPTPATSSGSRRCPAESTTLSGRSTSSSPTPAARRWAARSTTRSRSGKRPTARWCSRRRCWPTRVVPGMRERGWGRIVNVGSDLDPRADPLPQPLQHAPHGRGRVPEDALARGRRRRDHRQHRRHRQIRHRPARRQRRLAGRRRRGRAPGQSPPGASACPRSTATSSPSSAPSAPPTSPAPSIPIDGGLLRGAY